jgi:hypothetical protein
MVPYSLFVGRAIHILPQNANKVNTIYLRRFTLQSFTVTEFEEYLSENQPKQIIFSTENCNDPSWKKIPILQSRFTSVKSFLLPPTLLLKGKDGFMELADVSKIRVEEQTRPTGCLATVFFKTANMYRNSITLVIDFV